jgi:adenine-specific DNA-methyltransferase
MYVAFIEKACNLLSENGELIFIIPSDFFKLTSASKLKEHMLKCGSFTHIYHPHKENLFQKATQDVVVFRYAKGVIHNKVLYNDEEKDVFISKGNIYFKDLNENNDTLGLDTIFDVKVGMVSGAEKVFANNDLGNIRLYTSSGEKQQILIDSLEQTDECVMAYLSEHKKHLIARRIRKFNESNWFQWGCLRNKAFMQEHKGSACIYAKVLTRNKNIFHVGHVDYFDGSLLCLYPKQPLEDGQIKNIVEYLNTDTYLKHFLYSGRYKVGQKTLADSHIPKSLLG